jgi:rubrerythrin
MTVREKLTKAWGVQGFMEYIGALRVRYQNDHADRLMSPENTICIHCDGRGWVLADTPPTVDCPVCGGTGR